jgi:hypothetical protein
MFNVQKALPPHKVVTKSSKIREAVLTAPYLIPSFLKDPNYNPIRTKKILNNLISHRVGIEIECIGHILNSPSLLKLIPKDLLHLSLRSLAPLFLCKKLKIFEINNDADNLDPKATEFFELQVSILNYKHLLGLYKVLEYMKEGCTVNTEGSIHIHIDISFLSREDRFNLAKILKAYRKEVATLFDCKYDCTAISKEVKGSGINIRYAKLGTVEFRLGYCTFDYETIMKWVIGCTKITNKAVSQLKQQKNKIKKNKTNPNILCYAC